MLQWSRYFMTNACASRCGRERAILAILAFWCSSSTKAFSDPRLLTEILISFAYFFAVREHASLRRAALMT